MYDMEESKQFHRATTENQRMIQRNWGCQQMLHSYSLIIQRIQGIVYAFSLPLAEFQVSSVVCPTFGPIDALYRFMNLWWKTLTTVSVPWSGWWQSFNGVDQIQFSLIWLLLLNQMQFIGDKRTLIDVSQLFYCFLH